MAKSRFTYPTHQQPSRVTFGTRSLKTLADLDRLDETVFFVSGQPVVCAAIDAALEKRGRALSTLRVIRKPAGEPTREMVTQGAGLLRGDTVRIVAIGGGSVLDWARLAWAEAAGLLRPGAGSLADGVAASRPELWLIPTTCGSGAEAAAVAVYSDADGRKIPVVSRQFLADRVVLDGQFLAHQDEGSLACSLGDALSHAIEAFVSIVPGALAKESAVAALHLLLAHGGGPAASCRNDRLMEAGYLGGVAASNCSVGIVHAFAHAVSAYGVSHGRANALGLVPGMRVNRDVPALQALPRRVGSNDLDSLAASVRDLVRPARAWAGAAALRSRLADADLRQELRGRIREDVCLRTNPKPPSDEELDRFLLDVAQDLAAS